MRGHRQKEAVARAHAVVHGGNHRERNPYVLSIAADIVLSDSLKAKKRSEKHGILSHRQIYRRKTHEVYVPGGTIEYNPRSHGGGRSVRRRHAEQARSSELGLDGSF